MQQLTNAEEQVMEHLWKLEPSWKTCLKLIKTKTSTNHRYFKRMIDKQFVAYMNLGTQEYYPLVKKPIISRNTSTLISNFFNFGVTIRSLFYHRNQFVSNGIGRSQENNRQWNSKKKKMRLSNQIDNYFIRATGSVLFVLEKEKIHFQ
jgi:predicted transcriptional regulator